MSAASSQRVLHVCKVFYPVAGGVQKVVQIITSLLSKFNHTVVTTGEDGAIHQENMAGVEVVRCRSYGQIASMPLAPSLIKTVRRQIKAHDLIAVHYPFPLAELALALTFSNKPIVVHWHSNIVVQKRLKWLVAPLTWIMLLRAHSIVTTSERMLDSSFWLRHFRSKVEVIPYGLENSIDTAPAKSGDQSPYFVLIGRHVSYKGIDVAIRAVSECDSKLVVVGDGPLYEQHKKLVNDLNLADRVKFERRANDTKLYRILSEATALVVSSVGANEAFALVQIEAMRQKKAIINTDLNSSVPWVARDQQEAITVPPGDPAELAKAMRRLIADRHLALELGDNGFLRFQQIFSADKFKQSVHSLYSRILDGTAQ